MGGSTEGSKLKSSREIDTDSSGSKNNGKGKDLDAVMKFYGNWEDRG